MFLYYLHAGVIGIALFAASNVQGAVSTQAQVPSTSPTTGTIIGTLYDPFGKPAEQTLLTIARRTFSQQARTDNAGRFRFADIPAGRYTLITGAGDTIAPAVVTVTAGMEVEVKARLSVQPTVVKLRVCRDCDAAFYRVPELTRVDATRPRDERSAAILAPAEPEEGWNAFYEQSRPYPPTLKDPTLEGEVILEGTISPEGTIVGLRVASSTDLRLSDVALDMVQPQRWQPARVRAMPIESQLQTTVEFTVRGFR